MTPVNRTFAAQPPIGPVGEGIAKFFLIILVSWLGYSLIYALADSLLWRFGEYAWHVRWGLVTAWVVFTFWYVCQTDLNEC